MCSMKWQAAEKVHPVLLYFLEFCLLSEWAAALCCRLIIGNENIFSSFELIIYSVTQTLLFGAHCRQNWEFAVAWCRLRLASMKTSIFQNLLYRRQAQHSSFCTNQKPSNVPHTVPTVHLRSTLVALGAQVPVLLAKPRRPVHWTSCEKQNHSMLTCCSCLERCFHS